MKNDTIKKYVINNFTPRKNQRARIKKLYNELQGFLGTDKCFQTGSYARFTAIRPVHDLDIFYIFGSDLTTDDAVHQLPELAKKIENEFKGICSEEFTVEIQNASIELQFDDEFSIDIVPAIETGKTTSDLGTPIYIVPNRKTTNWKWSDPKGYKEITKQTDEASEKNLRRTIRFVKGWRKGCKARDNDFKLKSFHIEQIFIEMFQEDNNLELYDAIKKFYDEVPNNLLSARFEDRAYENEPENVFIDEYVNELTTTQRDQILQWSSAQLGRIQDIELATNEDEILRIIGEIMSCSNSVNGQSQTTGTSNSFTPSGQHLV
jgi:hypothetical protein